MLYEQNNVKKLVKELGATEEEHDACRYRCRRPRGSMSVGHGNDVAHGRRRADRESQRALHSYSASPVSSLTIRYPSVYT